MNPFKFCSFVFSLFFFSSIVSAETVKELPFQLLPKEFRQLANELVEIDSIDHQRSITLAKEGLESFSNPYIRHDLIFWELASSFRCD